MTLQLFRENTLFSKGAYKIFMILFSVLQILPIFMPLRISKFLFFNVSIVIFISGIFLFQDTFLHNAYFYYALFLGICLLIDNYIFLLDKYADKIDSQDKKTPNMHLPLFYRRNLISVIILIFCISLLSIINREFLTAFLVLFTISVVSFSTNYFLLPFFLLNRLKVGYKKKKDKPLSKVLIYRIMLALQKKILFIYKRRNMFLFFQMVLISFIISLLSYKSNHAPFILFPNIHLNIFFIAVFVLIILLLISFSKWNSARIGGSCFIFNICGALIALNIANTGMNWGGALGLILLISILIANLSYIEKIFKNKEIINNVTESKYRIGGAISRTFFKPLFLTFCCFSIGLIPLFTEQDTILKLFGLVVCFGSLSSIFAFCFYIPLLYIKDINPQRNQL